MAETVNTSHTLNSQQKACVEYDGANLLVLAGAGTGKTFTIIERAKYLISKGVKPHRMLILSFTRKSAREIVSRISASVNSGTRDLKGLTFHSWCREIITVNPSVFPNSTWTVLDEDDAKSCFSLLCGKNFKKNNFIAPEDLMEVFSFMVNTRCSLSKALEVKIFNSRHSREIKDDIEKKRPEYEKIIRQYIAFKKQRHYLDFDDLLMTVANAMAKNPEVRKYIATHYDYILVDEMQDTNPLQYHLLDQFAGYCRLFCVGDDAQSIYAFRGADFNSIHNFTQRIPNSDVRKLTLNYRSTQPVLDVANWVLNHSPLHYDKYLQSYRGKGPLPQLIHFGSEYDEAEDIVMKIKESVGEEGYAYTDNMVISRSLFGLRHVEACLIEAKIPYMIFGGSSLLQSAHVRDVVAALRISVNHRDELAWHRFLKLWPGIGDITASRIVEDVMGCGDFGQVIERLASNGKVRPEATLLLSRLHDEQNQPASALHTSVSGMDKILQRKYEDDWSKRREDFDVLESVALGCQNISGFVSEYVLDPKAETGLKGAEEGKEGVILTTIHQAKGLESKKVFILDVSWYKFPNTRAITAGEEAIEEERRCLYVALTRAKDQLYIYRTDKAMRVDNPYDENTGEYYFLNNMPSELTQNVILRSTTARWNSYTGNPINVEDLEEDFDFS